MKLNDLKAGDKIVADGGFTCLAENDVCEVFDGTGGLYVRCDEGHHMLDGQLAFDGSGEIVGFKRLVAR